MEKQQILNIVYYVIYGIFGIISFILAVKQKAKQKNISKLQALYECIPNAVIKAEEIFGCGNGDKKKELVMTNLMNIALTSKTKFNYAELDKQVENVVKATKNVNVTIESVAETFPETVDESHTENKSDTIIDEHHETDGAVVIEIDKIGEK